MQGVIHGGNLKGNLGKSPKSKAKISNSEGLTSSVPGFTAFPEFQKPHLQIESVKKTQTIYWDSLGSDLGLECIKLANQSSV